MLRERPTGNTTGTATTGILEINPPDGARTSPDSMDLRCTLLSAHPHVLSGVAVATLMALPIAARQVMASDACERVRTVGLSDATVTATETVGVNAAPFYAAREFCRVRLTIAPTRDSEIKAEVW